MTTRLTFILVATFISQISSAQPFGEAQILADEVFISWATSTCDLDGDGDLDIVACNLYIYDRALVWFENLGGGLFGPQQIIYEIVEYAESIDPADLDNDGDMDLLSASPYDDRIAWYENLGGGVFVSQLTISTQADGANNVCAADLDGDGDLDVLSTSKWDDKIAWYTNLGGGVFSSQHVISTQANYPSGVHSADLDGDGDLDVLSASNYDGEIAWYKNLGGGLFSTQQIISQVAVLASSVHSADLDDDGDMDVLSASNGDFNIAWYENLGGGSFGYPPAISMHANFAHDVYATDLDGDGDEDVLSSSSQPNKIAWNENFGGGNFGTMQIIAQHSNGIGCLHAADLDGDGDKDIITSGDGGEQLIWYENLTGEGCTDIGACNYDTAAWIDNGNCCYSNCGCTDPIALNYLPEATCDNGSCIIIEGCTNELATNYNSEAAIDDGSCVYSVTGTVFFDENEDGVMNGDEYGLPLQTVLHEQSGLTYLTNDEGQFISNIGLSESADYTLPVNPLFPFNSTPNHVSFDAEFADSSQIRFGVSNEVAHFEAYINFYPVENFSLCNEYSDHYIMFRNTGNVAIDCIIEIEYDTLFQAYQELTPIDSSNSNTVYMSFDNLLPGQAFVYQISLLTPTVDHIGEFVTSYSKIYGYYEGEQVAYGENQLTMEITCAYDPNDKQAFPQGYTDQHLLLQETQQEFLIRFQNTGNAPAQNIRIQDTLDVNFDMESFRLIANSHSVITTIDPETRLIDFYFENIQLPDSVSNEPASHGVISYMITPLPDLPVGTVLENTAFIYFDNNDPIITNTTWSTIHECGGESAFDANTAVICGEQQVNFESTYEFVEEYSWQVDGVEVGVNPNLLLSSIDNPEYEVTLTASNPLCTETSTLNYEVPDITSIDPCRADFNCDGNRDTEDLLIFMGEFGCLNTCAADLDSNAIVNVADLFILVSVFDQSCWE